MLSVSGVDGIASTTGGVCGTSSLLGGGVVEGQGGKKGTKGMCPFFLLQVVALRT